MFKFKSPGITSFEDTESGEDEPEDPDFGKRYKLTEGSLDGPYDIAYSRIDAYMDTTGSSSSEDINYGIKAQMLSFYVDPGNDKHS